MEYPNFFKKPTEIDSEETVSRAVGKMMEHPETPLLVRDKGAFIGLVTCNSLALHNITEPESTKIKHFIEKTKPVSQETDIRELVHSILINDYSAVPIDADQNKIFVITHLDALYAIKNEDEIKGKKTRDIMSFPYCIASTDTIATAKAMLKDLGISHLPVLDKDNRIEGIVDAESLLKTIVQKKREGIGEEKGRTTKLEGVHVSSIIKKVARTFHPNSAVSDIIEHMLKNKSTAALIEESGELTGIITPKDIFKLIGERVEGVYVRVSGIQDEDPFIKSIIDEEIVHFVRKVSKIFHINYMTFHIEKHKKDGRRSKYSIKSTLFISKGALFANSYGWDLTKAMKDVLEAMEKMVIKKKEKK